MTVDKLVCGRGTRRRHTLGVKIKVKHFHFK